MKTWFSAAGRLFPFIMYAVGAVERLMTAQTGKEKQDAALGMVRDLVPMLEATIGRELLDEDAVQDGIRKVIDAVVALQNVIRDVMAKRNPPVTA